MKKYLIYIFIGIFSFSCNLFEPRDAEKPTVEKSSYKPPTTPDVVIENLTNSIVEKNSIDYVQCLGGANLEYSFAPAIDAKTSFVSVFSDWDLNAERAYFENLIIQTDKNASSSLNFSNINKQSTSDSVIYNANYIFTFNHSASNISRTANGNLQFTIRRDKNNNWYITKWTDIKVQNQFSWSDMKARFSN